MVTAESMEDSPDNRPRRRVSLFGATGSIGTSTIDILARYPDSFAVEVVTADRNAESLAEIARRLGAKLAVVADPAALASLKAALAGTGIGSSAGPQALVEAAQRPVDLTVAAIVGAAGLAPTLASIEAGSDIALANKECLVSAGDLFMESVRRNDIHLLPVDSEHNAIFQALGGNDFSTVERIILTASGGPFLGWTEAELIHATPDQATSHPNWNMGKKVSVDSSTLMNKGCELIEAKYLFGLEAAQIEILIHPQSIVHGLVSYRDGSVLAQMSVPDMHVPLANCLWWPERKSTPHRRLDLAALTSLTFEEPDHRRFPGLPLARRALEAGGWATNILNAANEIAVDAFLNLEIAHPDIVAVVEDSLTAAAGQNLPDAPGSLEEALAIDAEGRRLAQDRVTRLSSERQRTELI